jgi:hypothetical protein
MQQNSKKGTSVTGCRPICGRKTDARCSVVCEDDAAVRETVLWNKKQASK